MHFTTKNADYKENKNFFIKNEKTLLQREVSTGKLCFII